MFLKDKYKIKEPIGDIETHEVFLDKLAHRKEEEFGFSEKKFEVEIKEKLIYSIFILFFIFSVLLFSKTFYLQVFNGQKMYNISQNNGRKINLIRPERGIIYDKNLKKLVLNSPAYDFVCDKRNFSGFQPEPLKELENVSEVTGKDYYDLKKIIEESEESKVLISENIDQKTLLILEARIKDFPDCQIEKNTIRNYVMGPIFSHVLGYMGRINKEELESVENYTSSDYIGKVGLEKYYEEFLRGV